MVLGLVEQPKSPVALTGFAERRNVVADMVSHNHAA